MNREQAFLEAQKLYEKQITELQQQLGELKIKYENCNSERYKAGLKLQQFYSRLGVEAFGNNIQEHAIEELNSLIGSENKKNKWLRQSRIELKQQLAEKEKEFEKYRKEALECYNTSENEIFKLKCEIIQLKTQLHTQPKEIVEKIKHFIGEDACGYEEEQFAKDIAEYLDKILKEYEEK